MAHLEPFKGAERQSISNRLEEIVENYRVDAEREMASLTPAAARRRLGDISSSAGALRRHLAAADSLTLSALRGYVWRLVRPATADWLKKRAAETRGFGDRGAVKRLAEERIVEAIEMATGHRADTRESEIAARYAAVLTGDLERAESLTHWPTRLDALEKLALSAAAFIPATRGGGSAASRHARTFDTPRANLVRRARSLFETCRPGEGTATADGPLDRFLCEVLACASEEPKPATLVEYLKTRRS